MRESDLAQVLDIEQASYEFPWKPAIFQDCLKMDYCCEVLYEGPENVRAYGFMSAAVGEAHLLNLCVAPLWRRTGMARYLLNHLIEQARQRAAYVMFLEVRPSNRGALALYRQNGFAQIGRRKDYYPSPEGREDAIILSRDIE